MRFLIIAPRFHTNLYYRVISLKNAGHLVKVLVMYEGKSESYENVDIKLISLSVFSKILIKSLNIFKKNKLKTTFELRVQSPNRRLTEEIKNFKPDVIILKAYQNMLALKALIVAKRLNIKVLMLTQTTLTHIKGSTFLFRLNIILFRYLRVNSYITPVLSSYDAFKRFGIVNVFYVPFVFPAATSLSEFESKIKSQIDPDLDNLLEVKIMSVGKFVKRKDQLLLVKAVHELLSRNYKVKLNLYGEKADEKYFNLIYDYIKKHKLEQHIRIHSDLDYSSMLLEYKKHNLFVLPSYAEPAAYSVVEALANGLPVICSSENGTNCYIEEGTNGLIFKAKNLKDLSEKLKIMISSKDQLIKFSKNSLLFAIEKHNPDDFAKKISLIIKE